MLQKLSILLLVSTFIIACASMKTDGIKVVREKHHRLRKIPDMKLYDEITANYLDYKNINFKKITIEVKQNGKTQQARASLRILKDSLIWLSLSKMGIEGMRAKLTPDSVFIVDRLHKEYLKTDYSYLKNKFNVDLNYYLIQSLLTNELPEYRVDSALKFTKKYKGRKSKTHYLFYTKNRYDRRYWKMQAQQSGIEGSTSETLRIAPDIMRVESIDIYDTQYWNNLIHNVSLRLTYKDYFRFSNSYLFPKKIQVNLNKYSINKYDEVDGNAQSLKVTFSIQNMEVNKQNLSFPFSISSKYKPINE